MNIGIPWLCCVKIKVSDFSQLVTDLVQGAWSVPCIIVLTQTTPSNC